MTDRRPFLMKQDDAVSIKEAARRSHLSPRTIRRFYDAHDIGRQSCRGAPVEISYPALVILQSGDMEALELLREGQRRHPYVRRYLELLGTD